LILSIIVVVVVVAVVVVDVVHNVVVGATAATLRARAQEGKMKARAQVVLWVTH
jgi:hypothetical protein